MADKPVDEVVQVDAALDALVSPTSSDVYEALNPYSDSAVAAVAAKRAAAGGAAQPIVVARITLTSAWILAHSTDYAIQVIVAGDPTKQIILIGGVASLVFATTAYAGAGSGDTDILVGFGDTAGTPADVLSLPTDMWEATDDTVTLLPPNVSTMYKTGQVPGEDLRVYLVGAGLTDGDSDVVVTVAYTVVDLAG